MLSWREPNDVTGPFIVTSEVPGPFQVTCLSYDLAALATVVEDEEENKSWFENLEGNPLVLIALTGVCLGAGIMGWVARRKWPFATVLLYTFWLAAVLAPVLFSIAWMVGRPEGELREAVGVLSELYLRNWPFWIFCCLIVFSQILLLAVPIRIVKERPVHRRTIWATAIAAATLFAFVALGIVLSLGAALWGDESLESLKLPILFILFSWAVWAWVFRGFAHTTDPRAYVRRLMKWLLAGSILELLVAVPSHIVVRQKDVCCAHGLTAIGIATGLVVILMSFGPGLYFLYAERIRSKDN
ncbi:hypothetical protein ACFL3Q_05225 [Planctomycetota bacterium]